jgi:hypothetical protein
LFEQQKADRVRLSEAMFVAIASLRPRKRKHLRTGGESWIC